MAKILYVEDDPSLAQLVVIALERAGHRCTHLLEGTRMLEVVRSERPDAIVLDWMLPGTDGIELCRELKGDVNLRRIPVLFLTSKSEPEDKTTGFLAGADDYMVKPFSPIELVLRVEALLRRSVEMLDRNPLTRMPGQRALYAEIERRMKAGQPYAVCQVDLNHFKAYNDAYGFARGDEVIIMTGRVLSEIVEGKGGPADFAAHLGGDDFLLIVEPECVESVCRDIVAQFSDEIRQYFSSEDVEKGSFESVDRAGNPCVFPLTSIAVAVVVDRSRYYHDLEEISADLAEIKRRVKASPGGAYAIRSV
ncbi:MAG TPA: diguanylate cyclase [Anaerolineae bacterium]|nr:diguanylate cyclase [Anaerolineae bacterium]